MDIPPNILEDLKCSSCGTYLSRGPVYLQHDEEAICNQCFTPKHLAIRNKQYETTARLLLFPCKYQELGCRETVPFVQATQEVPHEQACEYRQYQCPILASGQCEWLGRRRYLLEHCRVEHPDRVLTNPCNFTHDITKSSISTYLLIAFEFLFLLHTKICLSTGQIYHSIRFFGDPNKASNFNYSLDIKRGNEQLSKIGKVVPQGCLAIQEDSSLAISTNSVLNVLGGFSGTTFTISVKRLVIEAVEHLAENMEQLAKNVMRCAECSGQVIKLLYRDEKGWRCEQCAPAKRACENRSLGCRHRDIDEKCLKHEVYFCSYRTRCSICRKSVSGSSLSEHYDSAHSDITYKASSPWRAMRTGLLNKCCMVSGDAGTAVCWYLLYDSMFVIDIRIPVLTERLHEFCCVVHLTDPTTKHTLTYIPDVLYADRYDWRIQVETEKFPSWKGDFLISVDISKI